MTPMTKRDCVINPQNYDFNQFYTENFDALENATNQLKSTVELGYMCPLDLFSSIYFTCNSKKMC